MKRITPILLSLVLATACHAAVTFTFDTTLEGFEPANFGDGSANTAVSYSTVNGGSMAISNSRTPANVFGTFGDVAKFFTNNNQTAGSMKALVYSELLSAATNGGTISYDVIFTSTSFTGTTPGFAEVGLFSQGGGAFDRERVQYNSTQLGASNTRITVPFSVALPQANNDGAAFIGGNNNSFQLGFASNFNNATNFTYYIDNLTIAAVPEPTSIALLGLGSILLARRKRS